MDEPQLQVHFHGARLARFEDLCASNGKGRDNHAAAAFSMR
jgi:hypothetical protein